MRFTTAGAGDAERGDRGRRAWCLWAACGGFGAVDGKIEVVVRMCHEGGEVNRYEVMHTVAVSGAGGLPLWWCTVDGTVGGSCVFHCTLPCLCRFGVWCGRCARYRRDTGGCTHGRGVAPRPRVVPPIPIVHCFHFPPPSYVYSARAMPQASNIIATKSPSGTVFVFDSSSPKHHEAGSEHKCQPEARLSGHTEEGYGLSWSLHDRGRLLSGADDERICVWDIERRAGSDGTIAPSRTFTAHSGTVEARAVGRCLCGCCADVLCVGACAACATSCAC